MFIVENDSRSHAPYAVTAITLCLPQFISEGALIASWGIRLQEPVGHQVAQEATLLTDHLLDAPVELNGHGPTALHVERDLRLEGFHGGFEAVDILGVESLETIFLSKTGEHFMEFGGLGLSRLDGQRPHQLMEGGGQSVLPVDGCIEQQLAGRLQVVFLL